MTQGIFSTSNPNALPPTEHDDDFAAASTYVGPLAQITKRGEVSLQRAAAVREALAELRRQQPLQIRYAELCASIAESEARRCKLGDRTIFGPKSNAWIERARLLLHKTNIRHLAFGPLTEEIVAEGEAFEKSFAEYCRNREGVAAKIVALEKEVDLLKKTGHRGVSRSLSQQNTEQEAFNQSELTIIHAAVGTLTSSNALDSAELDQAEDVNSVAEFLGNGSAEQDLNCQYALRQHADDTYGPAVDHRMRSPGKGLGNGISGKGDEDSPIGLRRRVENFMHPLTVQRAWKLSGLPRRWPHQAASWRLEGVWAVEGDGPVALAVPSEGEPLLCRLYRRVRPSTPKFEEIVFDAIRQPTTTAERIWVDDSVMSFGAAFMTFSGDETMRLAMGMSIVARRAAARRRRGVCVTSDGSDSIAVRYCAKKFGLDVVSLSDCGDPCVYMDVFIIDAHLIQAANLLKFEEVRTLILSGDYGSPKTWSVNMLPNGKCAVSMFEWAALLGAERCVLSSECVYGDLDFASLNTEIAEAVEEDRDY